MTKEMPPRIWARKGFSKDTFDNIFVCQTLPESYHGLTEYVRAGSVPRWLVMVLEDIAEHPGPHADDEAHNKAQAAKEALTIIGDARAKG